MILQENILKQMLTIIITVIFLTGCNKDAKTDKLDVDQPKPTVTENANPDCVEFVALWSAADIAQELGKTKKWVFLNYTVDLWEIPNSEESGVTIGKLRASSYAQLFSRMGEYYLVESPMNGVQGWLNTSHVKSIVKKNPITKAVCE